MDNRMVLQLPEALLFDRGRAALRSTGRRCSTRWRRPDRCRRSRVPGCRTHRQRSRGQRAATTLRLAAVRGARGDGDAVPGRTGVPKARLSAAAHADTRPATPSTRRAGRRQNRRIEIVLIPRLHELPDLATLDALAQRSRADAERGAPAAAAADRRATAVTTPAMTEPRATPSTPAPSSVQATSTALRTLACGPVVGVASAHTWAR